MFSCEKALFFLQDESDEILLNIMFLSLAQIAT